MADTRIHCKGFEFDSWHVPPFTLEKDACVTLVLPTEFLLGGHGWNRLDRFAAMFTGDAPCPSVVRHGTVRRSKVAQPLRGWRSWLRKFTPFDWLHEHTRLDQDAIAAILRKHSIRRDLALNRYAGNTRALLGMEAAYEKNPDTILVELDGHFDPLGRDQAFELIASHLHRCSTLLLSLPYTCNGKVEHDVYPGSEWVQMTDLGKPVPATLA